MTAAGRRSGSPHVAAFLSLLWPGLGQLYAGRTKAAALFALPVLGIVAILVLPARDGLEQLAAMLLSPTSALTVFILVVLVAAWRILAIADSMIGYGIRQPWRRRWTGATFAACAVLVLVVHGAVAVGVWSFYEAGSKIFVADPAVDSVSPPPASAAPGPTATATAAAPTAPPEPRRITILLTGIDSATSRTESLNDTLLVASIDPTTKEVALVSFPRDIAEFPLWTGDTYRGKINSLMNAAERDPERFPDGPIQTVVHQLSYLLGIPIDYYAALDLDGFRRMIDVVGGVVVDNPNAINDPRYDWLDGRFGFRLAAGVHDLDGRTALAYVRSRQGVGDNDFTRARRQQQVLVALRAKLTNPEMLPQLPAILDAAGDTIRTNFPSDRVGEILALAKEVDESNIEQVVLGPPFALHPPMETTGGIYILRLEMDRLAEVSVQLFGRDSKYYVPVK